MKNKDKALSRRSFLIFKNSNQTQTSDVDKSEQQEKIKMLTPDGKLVEVDRSVIEKSSNRKKAGKEDIHFWTEKHSPSKL